MDNVNLKALIIDDEPLAHTVVLKFAEDIPNLEIIGQSYLAIEALDFLKKKEVDLLFLDIKMPKLNGLDFLRILEKKPLVIITSAYQEYALEGFELDVCDYLLKPFRFDRFLKAVRKATEFKELQNKEQNLREKSEIDSPNQLFIKSDKRFIQLDLANIFYLESYGNYVKVWENEQFHLTPKTLSSFEENLPKDVFIRIHKSFIINKIHIDYLEGNQLILKNGKAFTLGRSHRQAIKALIGKNN